MRPQLAVCTAFVVTTLASVAAAEDDPWLGTDKALHFGVSVALGGAGYAASSAVLDERWQRATAGGAFSLTIGAGKELYDLSGAGTASWKDFTWDVAGTAVGVGLAWLIDLALSSSSPSPGATRETVR